MVIHLPLFWLSAFLFLALAILPSGHHAFVPALPKIPSLSHRSRYFKPLLSSSSARANEEEVFASSINPTSSLERNCNIFKQRFDAMPDSSKLGSLLQYGQDGCGAPDLTTSKTVSSKVTKVSGCTSNVHLLTHLNLETSRIKISGQSDSKVVRGIVTILSTVFDNVSVDQIMGVEPSSLADALGIRSVLTVGRNDGVANMVRTVQTQIGRILEGGDEGDSGDGVEDVEDGAVEGSGKGKR
jgi:sulfur transfer protein SufE